jgi:hypothetical protein
MDFCFSVDKVHVACLSGLVNHEAEPNQNQSSFHVVSSLSAVSNECIR